MLRSVGPEAAGGLLQLPLTADTVAAPGLVPRDGDVDEPLEEVALLGLRRAPHVFEHLMRGEVLALTNQHEAALELRGRREPRRPRP